MPNATDSFEKFVAEGKSADEPLIKLDNAKEAIANDLFMKALVSTEQIPKD